MKRYLPLLKTTEDIFSSYGAVMQSLALWAHRATQSDTKHQKLLECVLTGNSKLYLGEHNKNEEQERISGTSRTGGAAI